MQAVEHPERPHVIALCVLGDRVRISQRDDSNDRVSRDLRSAGEMSRDKQFPGTPTSGSANATRTLLTADRSSD